MASIRPMAIIGALALAACAAETRDFGQPYVSTELHERTGHVLADVDAAWPPDCRLDDGVNEAEAVSAALWRNADFAAALAELDVKKSDLVQAGLLPNPVLSVLFPLGPKQLEFTAKLPLEALWLRNRRIAVAESDYERTANQLVETGLDLIVAVRNAFAELELANRKSELATRQVALRERASEFDARRLRNGDASVLDAAVARGALASARAAIIDAELARDAVVERLRALLALGSDLPTLRFVADERPARPVVPTNAVDLALASRPDVRAAELAVEAASDRAGLARDEYLTLTAVLDANGSGSNGFEAGPGVEVPLPIFHRGEAASVRADAELARAAKQYVALRRRVEFEVRDASLAVERAERARAATEEALEWLDAARTGASKRSSAGETDARPVLEAELAIVEARVRAAETEVLLRKSLARLERAVGRRLE